MADLTDRHYALYANNMHPVQLSVYEEYNRFLRQVHSKEDQDFNKYVDKRMDEVISDRNKLLNRSEGESLSIDDIQDIYIQVMAEARAKYNFTLTTKSKTGEINDYLELRRPFGAAQ